MQRTLRFEKDANGWFVVLPEWEGDKWELQMVAGADIMLDVLSEDTSEVSLQINTKKKKSKGDYLELIEFNPNNTSQGATYNYMSDGKAVRTVWLCHVAHFVFDEFPKTIYIEKVIR
jgi:hypothetical protein